MRNSLLKMVRENARLTEDQLAAMLNTTPDAVRHELAELEKEGIICGYHAVVDWEKVDPESATAMIELNVIPRKDTGFEELAETILSYPEVESLYLLSGGCDFSVLVKGRSFRQIANFVSSRLATLDGVQSTATHFVLRRYKESGVYFAGDQRDERGDI